MTFCNLNKYVVYIFNFIKPAFTKNVFKKLIFSNVELNIKYITRRHTCKCLILAKMKNDIIPANISITLIP